MNAEEPIWIAEAEVVSVIDLGEAITQVRAGFIAQAKGSAVAMGKAQAGWSGGTLHATGATLHSRGYVGTKSWTHTSGGAAPLLLLWSTEDGRLLAVLESFALGQYRTAAVTGVATGHLAADTADELAICGTGSQALTQVAAVNSVRELRRVRVWSPRPASREQFATEVRNALGLDVITSSSPQEAVDGAGIIVLATRAREPFLDGSAVAPGAHVNAIGAIGVERSEFNASLLKRARAVCVDDHAAAQRFSRELREFYGTTADVGWSDVHRLADVLAEPAVPDESGSLTVFKAMGSGIGDVALAAFIYEQAVQNQLGAPLPAPSRSRPRLRSSLQRPGAGYV